jgi:hypothetical protein
MVLALATLLMIGRLMGCGRGTNLAQPSTVDHGYPAEFLHRVIAKYQQAAAYSDRGTLKLSLTRQGQSPHRQSWNAAVQFARPGQLRIDANNLHLATDGTLSEPLFMARVEDAESNNIDNQMVVRRAPQPLSFDSLTVDPILFSQLIGRIQRPPVQLELLLGTKPLATLFSEEVKLAWLPDAAIADQWCRRLEAKAPEGRFVLWIDSAKLLLRRVEYPATALLPELAGDKSIIQASLVAELEDATFSPKFAADAFVLSIPPDAKRMTTFVMPVIALDAKLLGQPVQAFEFRQLNGEKLTPWQAKGKITAIFWYAHHPACEKPAQEFAQAAEKLEDNQQAWLICTEPSGIGDKAVVDQLAAWKVDLPPARDLQEFHERVFQVRELPAITLLDEEGRFQWMGSGPAAIAEFPEALNRLSLGENLADQALHRERLAREEYQRLVAAGGQRIDNAPAAASTPKQLKLSRKWRLEKLPSAGTLTVKPAEDGDRLLAVAGPRSVWEVASDGKVAARHDLPLPEQVEITSLRLFASDQTTAYAAFTPLQPKVHVFDEEWRLLFSYPPGDDAPPVRDVQWTDFDRNGEPELLVALEDALGLHAVSLHGEKLWSNRAYTPLLSIAPSHELPVVGRCVYVTGRGGICPITGDGIDGLAKELPGWAIAHLFKSRFEASQAWYVGIGASAEGEPCIIGLNKLLEEQWNYPLSSGTFVRPIDFVASGHLRAGSKGEWLVAWGDGSVHIVSEDGKFSDSFNTGVEIRGATILENEGQPLLIVASPNEVLAWEVSE